MGWFMAMQIFSTVLEWGQLRRKSESEKDQEILLRRRRHLAILERKQDQSVRLSRGEKLTLVGLAT